MIFVKEEYFIDYKKNDLLRVDELSLLFQPIVNISSDYSSETVGYEVLLRNSVTHVFPKIKFENFIQQDESNLKLLLWLRDQIVDIFKHLPNIQLHLNIHPQQLFFRSTWKFFEELSVFSSHINIELTEHVPIVNRLDDKAWSLLVKSIKRIKELGFNVSLDDVGNGINEIFFVNNVIENIDVLKFSLLPFLKGDFEILMKHLNRWEKLAHRHNKLFVVEGVENKKIVEILIQKGINYQQGYFWSKGMAHSELISLDTH